MTTAPANPSIGQSQASDSQASPHFRILADIAKELSSEEVVFSTHFDAILKLRTILRDPNISMAAIASALSTEPLICAKLLRIANSAAFNTAGQEIVDLKAAVTRLGINTVRNTALSIAMAQLLRAKGMSNFAALTAMIWEHSLASAAGARIIAKTLTQLNPDEAMLAGLVHDLGVFYMLYRATQYEELRNSPEALTQLIMQWHESIGVTLLTALGLPEEIVSATADHDQIRTAPSPIRTLSDVVYVANMLAGGYFELHLQNEGSQHPDLVELESLYGYLRPQIDEFASEMHQIFAT